MFTLITASILLAYAAVIYYSASEDREQEFYTLLQKEAITKANLFFDAKVDTQTLQDIYRSNRKVLNEVEVAIYDQDFNLLYHDAVDIDFVKETPEMIRKIYQKGMIEFYQEDWQVVGLKYEFNDTAYVITAAAYDEYGYKKLANLLQNSALVFVFSVVLIYLTGRFFSKKAFDPVRQMTAKAKQISATNLDLRLETSGSKDEIAALAETFNAMLARLENSFDAQRSFVSNIAHELRTPLAAMIAELELSLNKNQQEAAYRAAIENALQDAKKLVRLSNSLLDLAKASYDPSEIAFKSLRVDELLLDAAQQVQQANPGYKVDLSFENDFDADEQILVNGNEYLLKTAFTNLLENGCKFSENHKCSVALFFGQKKISLSFKDTGPGIDEADLAHVFTPFFRGSNKNFIPGNGIGLSLTQKIILLHHGKIEVASTSPEGTVFKVELPNILILN